MAGMEDDAETLERLIRLTLCLVEQRHNYPPGLLQRMEAAQAQIFWEMALNHTARPEWLEEQQRKRAEAIAAAASDPQERIRIAKIAAAARWKNHVKTLKGVLMGRRGTYVHPSGRQASVSQQTVKKVFSGEARKKSFKNGVPNLAHLHAARDIAIHWQKSTFQGRAPSRKAGEIGKTDYARYTRNFRKNGRSYNALITSKIILNPYEEILYSIELS